MQLSGQNWANNFSKSVGTGKKYTQQEANAFYALSAKTGISAFQLARDAERGIFHKPPAPKPVAPPPSKPTPPKPAPRPVAPPRPVTAPSPVTPTKPAPVIYPPPGSSAPLTIPIIYPATTEQPQAPPPSAPQVPEAPLPVSLPPVATMQPAAAPAPVQVAPAAMPMERILPWAMLALAGGFFIINMNRPPRRKRRG